MTTNSIIPANSTLRETRTLSHLSAALVSKTSVSTNSTIRANNFSRGQETRTLTRFHASLFSRQLTTPLGTSIIDALERIELPPTESKSVVLTVIQDKAIKAVYMGFEPMISHMTGGRRRPDSTNRPNKRAGSQNRTDIIGLEDRHNNRYTIPACSGVGRTRTANACLFKAALYQLSYDSIFSTPCKNRTYDLLYVRQMLFQLS